MNPKIPIANILALKTIVERFKGRNINWVLIGSTALAIHGVDVDVHDIDIKTDVENGDKIAEALKDYVLEPMHMKTSPQFKSYYGMFKINEVQVEVIADLEVMSDGNWTKIEGSRIREIKRFEGMTIPLLELKEEYGAYKRLGRMDKANKIQEAMDKEEEYTRRSSRAS